MKLLALSLTILSLSLSCTKNNETKTTGKEVSSNTVNVSEMKVDEKGLSELKVGIKTAKGTMIIKFYPQKAPITVARILSLIKEGFYDGLTFHRVIPNFVIQGGDPTGTGSGGSGQNIPAEFNDISHIKGTVAMARATDPNSADSQFYIARTTLPHLDKKYTVFGQLVEGFDVLDKINPGEKMLQVSIVK